MVAVNPLLGTALHGVGALSASVCYAPQKRVRRWSWQTYWWTQVAFCWFLLPIIGAVLTGLLWYGQFFFYHLGNVRMGTFEFTSWVIHMIMLVLFSTAIAVLFREWSGCRLRTQTVIGVALAVLIAAVLSLTYGNYLGAQ